MEVLTNLLDRLEIVADHLEIAASAKEEKVEINYEMTPPIQDFDELIADQFANYFTLSETVGDDVAKHAKLVSKCFDIERDLLLTAASHKVPSDSDFQTLIQPLVQAIDAVVKFKEQNRSSKQFNNLCAVAESVPALGWVTVKPTPSPYVKDMADAGQFYLNRVLKDFKDKDQNQVNWCRSLTAMWTQMQAYVKQHHTTGLVWNAQGTEAAKPRAPGGIPVPPPPPPVCQDLASNGATAADGAREELFKALNRGADVTTGLRKVTDDMKTHKNPNLRAGNTVTEPAPASHPKVPQKPWKAAPAKPPCLELRGNKWCVEYHAGNKEIVVNIEEIKQSVYVFKCTDCTIQVKGKLNSITLDNCQKVGIVFEDMISCFDMVNCQSIQAQVTGHLASISIDKTDGVQMYLSEKAKHAEILAAKSSGMNILVPDGTGDYVEYPIPEQFKSKFDGSKVITTVNETI